MAQNNPLKRFLDAGTEFSEMTQARAEKIVRELVKAGELQTEQAQAAVTELRERSRRNTEQLVAAIRKEVRDQVKNLGLATQADIARLERRIASLSGPAKKAPAKKAPAKKAAAKKTTAKKAAAPR